jgi:acyl transferase domain-containing protein/NAD(P)H-dependent flavin oxidoreductase YrpB (nitropropane dioxygenase family)/NAD(P)-dependent dehydrogenase (short-subunit alcohol dehydrogenase family)
MAEFKIITLTPPGFPDPGIAIAGCRAGGVGVLDLEYTGDVKAAQQSIQRLERFAGADFGIKLAGSNIEFLEAVTTHLPPRLRLVILSRGSLPNLEQSVARLSALGLDIILECTSLEDAQRAERIQLSGVIAKGHEAGGRVSHETTFILLQRLLRRLSLPIYAQGGIGLHTAAACYAAGAAGVVLDAQVLLTRESPLPVAIKSQMENMDGSETVCLGEEMGEPCRVISRFGRGIIQELQEVEQSCLAAPESQENHPTWRQNLASQVGWQSQERHLFLWGQDIGLAQPLAEKYVSVGGILQAMRQSIAAHGRAAHLTRPLAEGSPLAQTHGTRFPIVQGPMARVSDTPAFVLEVAQGGALPFVAAAWMRGPELRHLLAETCALLEGRPWGVGLLGFLEPDHYREQISAVLAQRPPFALIAGGHPEQVKVLEQEGIATYVHVPSPGLLRMFLERGVTRFVFEGRESGGHIGPLCSFVLWESAIEQLLKAAETSTQLQECQILFAGGIHDSLSAAMVGVMAATLAESGVRVGVQLGSAYLFTREAVTSGALVPTYQQEARRCDHTAVLTSGPGHAERCIDTPFAQAFREEKRQLRLGGVPPERLRQALDKLKAGRLRLAAKGIARNSAHLTDPQQPELLSLSEPEQRRQGIYLIGQLAALRDQAVTIAALHHDIAVEGTERIAALYPLLAPIDPGRQEELPSDVAVIGMACLLPRADSPSAYWENILNKVDTLREIPSERWDWRLYYDKDPGARDKICSKWGAFLDDIAFDPTQHGITPNSLASLESLQLLALEVTRRALENAGYAQRPFARSRTSVILGISGSGDLAQLYSFRTALPMVFKDRAPELLKRLEGFLPEWTEDSFPGILMNVAAGRIANRFDLGGLNCTVDAACASSLAAVYLAVRELEARTSDLVIVGGGDCMQNPFTYMCFSKTQALSSSGRSHALDEDADGIALGEGVVTLILKRLADAERDGDRIYAVIKSVAASSDGRGKSLTAPGREGQVRALTRAYRKAGVSPATVGLIEAHATGTSVGDRTEIEGLTQVFREAGATARSCAIGSVKSMIGHTKAAAGVASLMKTVLALHHRVLPPTLGVRKPNPALCATGTPFYVNTETRPWIHSDLANPRRAGVSALGFGGTNFHVVLEEYCGNYLNHLIEAPFQKSPGELLLWKGTRQEVLGSLKSLEEALQQETPIELPDLAFSLMGRFAHGGGDDLRLAVVAASQKDLRRRLAQAREALQGSHSTLMDPGGLYFTDQPLGNGGKLAFLFPGQGSQYLEMFADLAVQFPEFRETFEKADRLLADKLPHPLSSFIFPPPAFSEEEKRDRQQALVQTAVAQPALGAANLAMYKFLKHLEIVPAMVAGHGYGEYAALAAAGVFEADDLFQLSEARTRFIQEETAAGPGAMAAVNGDVKRRFAEFLTTLNIHPPQVKVFSNTTAAPFPADPQAIARKLVEHLANQVQFEQEIEAMYADGARIFVEVGPGRVLSGLVDQILGERPHLALASNQPGWSGLLQLQHLLGQLLVHGVHLKLDRLYQGRSVRPIDLRHPAKEAKQLPPTTWLVNGARAKPLREAAAISKAAVAIADLLPPVTGEMLAPDVKAPDMAGSRLPGGRRPAGAILPPPLASDNPPSPLAGPAAGPPEDLDLVMLQYQRLCRRFLDAQKRVMRSYLETSGERVSGPEGQGWQAAVPAPTEEVLPRFTLTAVPTPEPAHSLRLAPGRVVVITADDQGIAAALEQKLQESGLKTAMVHWAETEAKTAPGSSLSAVSPASLTHLVDTIRRERGPFGGLVHLFPLRNWTPYDKLDLAGWRERLQEDVKTLYLLLQLAAPDLKEAAAAGGAWVVSATGLGGLFASDPRPGADFFPGQGGIPGLLKTVAMEWPEIKVKCVDLALEEPTTALADHLLGEITAVDELVEVGYRDGRRLTLGLQETPLLSRQAAGFELDSASVILVTGGARGITAAVTLELARQYQPNLIVAGRAPLPPEQEEEETVGLTQPQELKAALMAKRQRQGQAIQVPEVEAAYLNLLKEREIRANLAALQAVGARVSYKPVDVRDSLSFGNLLDHIYSRYGRLDGVIHGAGIIEDKLLQDKSWESFDRVFGTKTESAFILSRKLRPESLKFLVFFSSVAGRFGSPGQADYTAANEVYNKLAAYLNRKWPGRVLAINWGPWKNAGMVSPGVQQQFEERGVELIEPADGARSFDLELRRGRKEEPEVLIGDGPWRQLTHSYPSEAPAYTALPLFQHLTTCRKSAGRLEIVRRLDPDHDIYLKDHRLDFKPVLPAAMAIEFMAEAAQLALPNWHVIGLKRVRVLKGIVIEKSCRDIQVQVDLPSSLPEPLELELTIKDAARPEMVFYKGNVVLSQNHPSFRTYQLPPAGDFQSFGLSTAEAYSRMTFHGPLFQGIQSIQGISEKGMLAILAPSSPRSCLAREPAGQWLLDPIVVDCGLQLGLLWWRTYLDVTPLPSSFEEIWLFQPRHAAGRLRCFYEVQEVIGQQTMYANIYFCNQDNQLLSLIKRFESTGSKALNRLAGSHLLEQRPNDQG